MMEIRKINPAKVKEIKSLLKVYTIRETGRLAKVSYMTARLVNMGKYDTDEPLQDRVYFQNRCPITGFLLRK